nr:DUF1643 domain-containing protein [Microlunatus panaciterrae]
MTRTWGVAGDGVGRVLPFILLNPSTATESVLDPTVRRCVSFAARLGYDGVTIVNLFAYRATEPRELKLHSDPIGPDNDENIRTIAGTAEQVVLGWGREGSYLGRDQAVLSLLGDVQLYRLGSATKTGAPRHPLYLPGDSPLVRHRGA